MATIKITSLATAQQQINSARPGDVCDFTGCSGTVSLSPKSGVKYVGGGARLTGTSNHEVFRWENLANASFTGFDFTGPAMWSTATSGILLDNVQITDNTFRMPDVDWADDPSCIWFWVFPPSNPNKDPAWDAACATTMRNCLISRNKLIGPSVYRGQYDFFHGRFDTPTPAGKNGGPGKSSGNEFSSNELDDCTRSTLELQGGGNGTKITRNTIRVRVFSKNQSVNSGSIVMSIATDAALGCVIDHNSIVGDGRVTDGKGFVNGIEAAGGGTVVTQNYIEGGNNGVNMQTPLNGQIYTNQIVNCTSNATSAGAIVSPGFERDNGPNTVLDWNPNGGSTPTPTPTPTPPNSANGTTCAPGSGSITFAGKVYSVTTGGQVKIDANVIASTANVILLLLWDNAVYEQTSGPWGWGRLNSDGSSQQVPGDPRPAQQPKLVTSVDTILHYNDGTTKTSTISA